MRTILKAIIIVLLLASILPCGCTVGALTWGYKNHLWQQRARKAQGQIVELVECHEDNGVLWQPIASYEYEGETRRYVSSLKSSPKPYEVGDTVTILIDPNDPNDVAIDSFTQLYFIPGILLVVSAPFLLICLAAIIACAILMRRQPKGPSATPNPDYPLHQDATL